MHAWQTKHCSDVCILTGGSLLKPGQQLVMEWPVGKSLDSSAEHQCNTYHNNATGHTGWLFGMSCCTAGLKDSVFIGTGCFLTVFSL